jgi:hypothetical protein
MEWSEFLKGEIDRLRRIWYAESKAEKDKWTTRQNECPDRHAFARLRDPEPLDEGAVGPESHKVFSVDAVLHEQHTIWCQWRRDAADHGQDDHLLQQIRGIVHRCEATAFTPKDIRTAARSFSTTTSSVDGMHPRQFDYLSDQALAVLADFFQIFEIAEWPTDEQIVMVRLVPLKDGGLRPIALFRAAYRIVSKMRVWQFRDWIQHTQRQGFNMTGQRRTLDAAWRCRIRDLARDAGYAAEIHMDLRKAFEQVNRGRLLDLSLHEGCPMRPLLLSLLSS